MRGARQGALWRRGCGLPQAADLLLLLPRIRRARLDPLLRAPSDLVEEQAGRPLLRQHSTPLPRLGRMAPEPCLRHAVPTVRLPALAVPPHRTPGTAPFLLLHRARALRRHRLLDPLKSTPGSRVPWEATQVLWAAPAERVGQVASAPTRRTHSMKHSSVATLEIWLSGAAAPAPRNSAERLAAATLSTRAEGLLLGAWQQ